jgi:hypothetical protein
MLDVIQTFGIGSVNPMLGLIRRWVAEHISRAYDSLFSPASLLSTSVPSRIMPILKHDSRYRHPMTMVPRVVGSGRDSLSCVAIRR